MSWREVEAGLGRRAAWAAAGAVALGIGAVASGLGSGSARRTVAALIASWLFFAGAAAGAAAFGAFFRIVDARWARPLAALGGVLTAFVPAASLVLVAILAWAGAAPWVATPSGWLGTPALAIRQLALNAILFGMAYFWLRPRPGGRAPPSRAAAIAYCIVYALVLSAWAFDFVLGPDPVWGSTLIGPYLFMGAFLAGTAAVTLIALVLGALTNEARRDVGTLILALAIFWGYLFWSQLLTMWYANIPDEVGFGLRRAADGWGWVVLAVVGLVFAAPFLALLHPAGRRSPRLLGGILIGQLLGLWLDCHLLVVPSLSPRGAPTFAPRDLLIALGLLGAFALSVAPALRRALVPRPVAEPGTAA